MKKVKPKIGMRCKLGCRKIVPLTIVRISDAQDVLFVKYNRIRFVDDYFMITDYVNFSKLVNEDFVECCKRGRDAIIMKNEFIEELGEKKFYKRQGGWVDEDGNSLILDTWDFEE